MTATREHHAQHIAAQKRQQGEDLMRILALSDSVIAVAITLLVLDIVMPTKASTRSLADQLSQNTLPGVLAFLYSYLIVADLWLSHHRIFHFIKRYDGRLIAFNLLFLGLIVFLPIPVYLFMLLGNSEATWTFYAALEAATGFVLFVIWLHATHHHRLTDEQLDRKIIRYNSLRLLMLPLSFLLSILLARINVYAAEISLLIVSMLYGMLRRIFGRRVATPERGWDADRLLMLSDAMIAVSMTLLVAKIGLPSPGSSIAPEKVFSFLASIQVQLWTYLLSFTIVGLYWAAHHRIFHFVRREDGRLVYLNFLFLFFIELLPIPNLLYATFGDQPLAIALYAIAQCMMGLMILFIWLYATGHHRLIDKTTSQQEIKSQTLRLLIPPALFLLSIAATLIGPQYALYFWLLVIVVQGVYLRVKHAKLHRNGADEKIVTHMGESSTESPSI